MAKKKPSPQRDAAITALLGALASGVVLQIAKETGFSDDAAGQFGSAATAAVTFAAPSIIGNARFKRRRGRERLILDATEGHIVRPVIAVIAILAAALLLAESLIGLSVGVIVDISAAYMGGTEETMLGAMGLAALVVVVPFFVVTAFFIIERGAHYFVSHAVRWTLLAIVGYALLRLAVIAILMPALLSLPTVISLVVIAGVLSLVAVGAIAVSRRNHAPYVAANLFRKLSPSDQRDALDLLKTSAATQTEVS